MLLATLFYAGMDLVSYDIVREFDAISLIVYVCNLPVITLQEHKYLPNKMIGAVVTVAGSMLVL